ncbi:septum formation inhibitor Maf [Flagellimonas myxillae]|uniref:septum formation inhibitor Maf n=1 Tax=Flagellimonas myxillae TaxID=2942214 RepID=UPI00201E97E0|nr:septum formation inhibitor Maf [Muricauda myxillae]MCL6266167.1 septum formation inhibitor Maf [Muricauda myxillae]
MGKVFNSISSVLAFAVIVSSLNSCVDSTKASNKVASTAMESLEKEVKKPKKKLSEAFKSYWYSGNAEITSYTLEQARYGELRDGHAVMIYVTEPFLPEKQVKADRNNPGNVSVLKLNATKKYFTGIYPYSVMSSTFYPIHDNQHALKTSLSMQEWCGHVYSQINNRDQFEFTSHSYFESEADQHINLDKTVLENEIWNKIRISPKDLPTGNFSIIPSLEYVRLRHTELKAYDANAEIKEEDGLMTYSITYPELERTLAITITSDFPHSIEGWTETFTSGFGSGAKQMTTKATKIKSIKTAYWGQNSNKDFVLRDSLGL